MKGRAWKAGLALTSLAVLAIATSVPRIALSQETSSDSKSSARKDSEASDKTKLSDVTRVSTEDTARQAAKEKAKDEKPSSVKSGNNANDADRGKSGSSVSELQPTVKAEDDQSAHDNASADRGDHKLKKIHGSVHGATGSAVRQGGAEVGAGTKSGKTHVYVETGRTENAQPH